MATQLAIALATVTGLRDHCRRISFGYKRQAEDFSATGTPIASTVNLQRWSGHKAWISEPCKADQGQDNWEKEHRLVEIAWKL